MSTLKGAKGSRLTDSAEKTVAPAKADRKQATKPTAKDPVVMCNSQCDADSVISDIWKFLTA